MDTIQCERRLFEFSFVLTCCSCGEAINRESVSYKMAFWVLFCLTYWWCGEESINRAQDGRLGLSLVSYNTMPFSKLAKSFRSQVVHGASTFFRFLLWQSLTPPGWDTNPLQVSSQQMLVLIYFTYPRRMVSMVRVSLGRREGHTTIQISAKPGIDLGTFSLEGRDLTNCTNHTQLELSLSPIRLIPN